MGAREGERLLQNKTPELPLTAVAGGAAVLAGVALWQLAIECERAWLRSYERPLLGEEGAGAPPGSSQRPQLGHPLSTGGERRRWVANAHHARSAAARSPHLAR